MEEEKQLREFEIEEKRRKDEKQHEIFMMQMMGNMFTRVAESFNGSQNYAFQQHQPAFQHYQQQKNNQYKNQPASSSNGELASDGMHYTSL